MIFRPGGYNPPVDVIKILSDKQMKNEGVHRALITLGTIILFCTKRRSLLSWSVKDLLKNEVSSCVTSNKKTRQVVHDFL